MKDIVTLSPKQEQAVFHKDGAILVKASAGSGKTRVLTERIKRLLPQTQRNILALTFTNKAGEEMKERLDLPDIEKRLFIGTFHSFCQKILENHGASIGIRTLPHIFEDEADRLRLIEQAIELTPSYNEKYKILDLNKKRDFCFRALGYISKIKRELCTKEETSKIFQDENASLFYNSYQELLQSQNAIDFDDLIERAFYLFNVNSNIASLYRRTYEYICVDEAQDLNKAQYEFLKALTNGVHKNVMFVGDPNQSIFAFNGSSADFMGENYFIKDFNPVKIIELNENYRSSIKVMEAAKKIMPEADDIVNVVKQGDFSINAAIDEDEEANWIINKIKELVKLKTHKDIEGEINYEKIAILGRTKYVFKKLEEKLKEQKIPFYYKITPGAIKFETKIMKIYDLALRVKLNPLDNLHGNELVQLLKTNYSNDLNILTGYVSNNIEKKILLLVKSLLEDGSNFVSSLNKYKSIIENENIGDDNEKKMIIDEIEEVIIHWKNYAKKTDRKSLHQFKNAMALGQTHPLAKNDGITLSTVHTMKGQQNEIIFVVGMDDETFPYYKAINAGGTEMVQEKNNAYVAFTRAKRFLYVSCPKQRIMPWGDSKRRNISRFLKPFEQDMMKCTEHRI